MREVLELSLSEWRRIAIHCENQELKDFLNQFYDMDGRETFVLHPVDRDTSLSVANVPVEVHRQTDR